LKELTGLPSGDEAVYGRMSTREKLDFWITVLVFGVQAGAYVPPVLFYKVAHLRTFRSVNTFSVLTSQYFSPQGYSEDVSGFMGATLLFAGIAASIVTSPLFDRVLTRHLSLTIRVFVPLLSATWLSLIWASKFALFIDDIRI
jgi:FLVCR family MFS transporter 7